MLSSVYSKLPTLGSAVKTRALQSVPMAAAPASSACTTNAKPPPRGSQQPMPRVLQNVPSMHGSVTAKLKDVVKPCSNGAASW